ncbi:MAG: hypothetical protein K2V71_08860 [Methylotenera sp.]|nr:hypothetical protein [Methylotenera sp.]
MDKRVIFAVAGSGKTQKIINGLDLNLKTLIITYTNENHNNLRLRILDKFKIWPANIKLETYFSFLYNFCSLPYLKNSWSLNGITFHSPPKFGVPKYKSEHYLSKSKYAYASRLSKLLIEFGYIPQINNRISKYYDYVYIDEVQDFAGNDFNFLIAITSAKTSYLCVGDFYQHTFDTSSDGNININLHNDYIKYLKKFKTSGIEVDTTSLLSSWRCSPEVCNFLSTNFGIEIKSARTDKQLVTFNFDDKSMAIKLFQDDTIVKLFSQESYKFPCFSNNWGKSKGLDSYTDVCIVLSNDLIKIFKSGNFSQIKPITRNKLYVACTRAKGDLYFIPMDFVKEYKQRY